MKQDSSSQFSISAESHFENTFMFHALVIDPNASQRCFIRNILSEGGWNTSEACSAEEAMRIIDEHPPKIVFWSLNLHPNDKFELKELETLGEMRRVLGASVHIVAIAEPGISSNVLEVILKGASEYLRQPLQVEQIAACSQAVLERSLAIEKEEKELLCPCRSTVSELAPVTPEFIGESEAIIKVFKDLARIVNSLRHEDFQKGNSKKADVPQPSVFITGETGTGKELVARMIHERSRHRSDTFFALNCSNLPSDLADAELFGSNPGAYTGASKEEQPGLWELASGGTLFLDEITEAPLSVQSKLLRVLQDGLIKRLGAKYWIKTNVQVIAATNRDIKVEIDTGRFRADLYHRLNLQHLHLPPLRERQEDVPHLAAHFASLHSANRVRLAHDAVKLLIKFSREYPWYGNIRELENVVRRAVMQSPDKMVYAVDLSAFLPSISIKETHTEGEWVTEQVTGEKFSQNTAVSVGERLEERVRRFKYSVVKETLATHHGNRSQAAGALGVSRAKLHRMLKDLEQHR